jgi:hypothetical protein
MGKIIEVNEGFIKDQLGELVRGSVEETLNAMLDKEAVAEHLKMYRGVVTSKCTTLL